MITPYALALALAPARLTLRANDKSIVSVINDSILESQRKIRE